MASFGDERDDGPGQQEGRDEAGHDVQGDVLSHGLEPREQQGGDHRPAPLTDRASWLH